MDAFFVYFFYCPKSSNFFSDKHTFIDLGFPNIQLDHLKILDKMANNTFEKTMRLKIFENG